MVLLKDNIVLACILAPTHLHSITPVDQGTYGSLCQFEYFSDLCLKVTTIEHRTCECLNSCKLPQVV